MDLNEPQFIIFADKFNVYTINFIKILVSVHAVWSARHQTINDKYKVNP